MAAPHLTAVPNPAHPDPVGDAELYNLSRGSETGAQRLRRLQHEARMLAREQVEALVQDFHILAGRAAEIAEGGEVYPAGVRDLASRIAADLPEKAKGLMLIMERAGRI